MKILAVSLLRLGDLLMLAPCLRALKESDPDAELHLLTNRENKSIAEMLCPVDRIHYFERSLIQQSLGDLERSVFEAEDRITDLSRRLNRQKFDKVINFTHNRLSGYLMGTIDSPEKIGMQADHSGRLCVQSSWFRFLNNFSGDESKHLFHYTDFYKLSAGVSGDSGPLLKISTNEDQVETVLPEDQNQIVINPWSSDQKKDWSDQSWINYMSEFVKNDSNASFTILGGPGEGLKINKIVGMAKAAQLKAHGAVIRFSELPEYLNRQKLLVTVDTAVKHLAAMADIKIIELSLGGSAPWKTGVYKENSLVIQSTEKCAPCDHFKACHRDQHYCAMSFDPTALASISHQFVLGHWLNLRVLAEEYNDQFRLFRTSFTKGGYWYLRPLDVKLEVEVFDHLISLAGWKIALNKDYLEPLFNARQSIDDFLLQENDGIQSSLHPLAPNYRMGEMNIDRALNILINQLNKKDCSDLRQTLNEIEKGLSLKSYLTQHLENLDQKGFSSIRQIQDSLNQLRQFQIAKLKIHQMATMPRNKL